jgi:hypothetical protein
VATSDDAHLADENSWFSSDEFPIDYEQFKQRYLRDSQDSTR